VACDKQQAGQHDVPVGRRQLRYGRGKLFQRLKENIGEDQVVWRALAKAPWSHAGRVEWSRRQRRAIERAFSRAIVGGAAIDVARQYRPPQRPCRRRWRRTPVPVRRPGIAALT